MPEACYSWINSCLDVLFIYRSPFSPALHRYLQNVGVRVRLIMCNEKRKNVHSSKLEFGKYRKEDLVERGYCSWPVTRKRDILSAPCRCWIRHEAKTLLHLAASLVSGSALESTYLCTGLCTVVAVLRWKLRSFSRCDTEYDLILNCYY